MVIACAKRMYETWLLASLETIAGRDLEGRPGLAACSLSTADVEMIKSPKNWLNDRSPQGRAYKETEDQEAMTRLLDINLARGRSHSFQRLCHALEEALAAIDTGAKIVTPSFPLGAGGAGRAGRAAAAKKPGKRRK